MMGIINLKDNAVNITLEELVGSSDSKVLALAMERAYASWLNNNKKELRKELHLVYVIAKRHHLYIYWHGKDNNACCGDQWEVYKKDKPIARICL